MRLPLESAKEDSRRDPVAVIVAEAGECRVCERRTLFLGKPRREDVAETKPRLERAQGQSEAQSPCNSGAFRGILCAVGATIISPVRRCCVGGVFLFGMTLKTVGTVTRKALISYTGVSWTFR